jgi:regulator of RNase E activity RraA
MDTSAAYYDAISAKLYTAVLADVMDRLGYRNQVMRYDIRPLYDGAQIVGRAATMLAFESEQDPPEPYKVEMALLDGLKPGEVIVMATHSMRAAIWGELLSTAAKARGGRGTIIDGLTRDVRSIIAMAFPTFAVGMTPADSKGRIEVLAARVPIQVGGVLVHDQDLVVADQDGCLAIPQCIEEQVITAAMEKVSGENMVRELLRQGASVTEVFREHGIL